MKKIILTLLIALATSTICNSQQIIAGIGTPGYSGNSSFAINAQLDKPRHLTFDNIGNLYFVEQGSHILRKIDLNGIISTVAGNGTLGYSGDGGLAVNAQLNSPRGICIDINGNIYIGDTGNNVIRKINTSGVINTIVGTGLAGFFGDGGLAINAQLNSPRGITLDSQGCLYISDANNFRVRKIALDNTISTFAGNGTNNTFINDVQATMSGFALPYDVKVYNNEVYVADINDAKIRKINPSGIISNFASIPNPSGLAFDNVGNLYATSLGNTLYKIDNLQNITTILDTGLSLPSGVAFDSNYNLFLSDTFNYQIKKISSTSLNINENELYQEVRIYPNPTQGELNIDTNDLLIIQNINLYDSNGRLVKSIGEKEINLLNNTKSIKTQINLSGIYILKIMSEQGIIIKKVIKY
jgi:sugar lactone lactonase YvrE